MNKTKEMHPKIGGEMHIPAKCDVVVVGAGPAGSAAAFQLAALGCEVVLIERSYFDKPRVGESLAPAVQPFLKRLGLWQKFLCLEPLPSYGTRSAWGRPETADHSHLITPYSNGWHIDRLAFDKMLAEGARQAGAKLCTGSALFDCLPDKTGFVLQITRDSKVSSLHARFLIDASGRRSAAAGLLKAQKIVFDRLVGIATQFNDDEAGSHCYTMVESTPYGWWYSAPVSVGSSMVMLMTDGDLAARKKMGTFSNWKQVLAKTNQTFNRITGREIRWGPKIFSAVSQRIMRTENDCLPWLPVGDACMSVDPISGSGVIRALRTAETVVQATSDWLNGDRGAIDRYESACNLDCEKYLFELGSYYNMEQRWPNEIFWRRRIFGLKDYMQRMMARDHATS
jgi:flavin-dependent dehydrogenase